MPLFSYCAINAYGKKIKGAIDAASLQEAKKKLVRQSILVLRVERKILQLKKGSFTRTDILHFTKELGRFLQAGLPLYEALSGLEEKYRGHLMHELLLDLCDQIRSGHAFSKALESHPSLFNLLYRKMIANAEQSASLPYALSQLSSWIERELRIKRQLVGALLYPGILFLFCLFILILLLFFVIPSLVELFEGKELHSFTRFVFACSYFALRLKWVFAVVFGFLVLAGIGLRDRILSCFLRAPYIKTLLSKLALVRFFRAASTLLEGGLPAHSAMSQASDLLKHPLIQKEIVECLGAIEAGESFEKAFSAKREIPSMIPRMLGIAQSSGRLSSMFEQIASIYEDDLEKSFARITTLSQPILLFVLGGIVGFVLLSVLLPLTDVSSFST